MHNGVHEIHGMNALSNSCATMSLYQLTMIQILYWPLGTQPWKPLFGASVTPTIRLLKNDYFSEDDSDDEDFEALLPDAYEGMKHRMKVLANGGKSKEASDDETGMVTDSMMYYFCFLQKDVSWKQAKPHH